MSKIFKISKKISKGFDRDIDYEPMKNQLINEFNKHSKDYLEKKYITRVGNKVVYTLISMIQLRNGSRISEAVNAFKSFIENGVNEKVMIKIAKSGGIKYKYIKNGHETAIRKKVQTKERYRKMMFPESWIEKDLLEKVLNKLKITHLKFINSNGMRQKMFKFMSRNLKSNTHSLRYAFINYMIYDQKRPLNDVAKFVGHVNVGQLVTYTQQKKCDQIFDLDI